ncbi:MAG: hypothetical protein L3J59_01815 [Methylococcaceae bacterium]|nr:hypothetical protein [Methylococcaceae bacterium]
MKKITILVSLFLSTVSQAEIISKSIPSFNGSYEYLNDARIVTFDMGVRFSSITSATIKLTAHGTNALAEVCNTIVTGLYSSYFSCMDYDEIPKAFYRFSSENFTESGSLVVDITDWNTTSVALSETNQLLDGKGILYFEIALLDFHGYITRSPTLHVSDLSIVIDGVVAPDTPAPSKDCIEIPATGTVSSNLDIHLPLMLYQSQDNDDNVWIDLEYLGTNSEGKHVWGMKSIEENNPATCSETVGTGIILTNTDFFMPTLNYETAQGTQNIWAKLKYVGKNSKDQQLWQLKGYGFNQ